MPGRLTEKMPVYGDEEVTEGAKKRWAMLVQAIENAWRNTTVAQKGATISDPDHIDFLLANQLAARFQNLGSNGRVSFSILGQSVNNFASSMEFRDRADLTTVPFPDTPQGAIYYTFQDDHMFFYTNRVAQMLLTTTGLGVGTIPTVALDVDGDIKSTGDLTVDTDTLVVDSTNNRVGVNKASPAVDFDVDGDASVKGALAVTGPSANAIVDLITNDGSRTFRLSLQQSGGIFNVRDDTASTNPFRIYPGASSDQLVINSTGVGVGGTPSEALDVTGNIKASGTVEAGGAVWHGALGTAPSSPSTGDMYFDTGTSKHRGYDGTSWNDFY